MLGLGDLVTPPKILVSKRTSPFWWNMYLPATGQRTGTGFFAVKLKNHADKYAEDVADSIVLAHV